MGKSGAGKTSMRSIIFANYIARDTNRLGPTMEVEHAHVKYVTAVVKENLQESKDVQEPQCSLIFVRRLTSNLLTSNLQT